MTKRHKESNDGTYWNVNSAGIYRKTYSRRKLKIHAIPAVGGGIITDTPEVNSGQTKGETAPAGDSPQISEGKVGNYWEKTREWQKDRSFRLGAVAGRRDLRCRGLLESP